MLDFARYACMRLREWTAFVLSQTSNLLWAPEGWEFLIIFADWT